MYYNKINQDTKGQNIASQDIRKNLPYTITTTAMFQCDKLCGFISEYKKVQEHEKKCMYHHVRKKTRSKNRPMKNKSVTCSSNTVDINSRSKRYNCVKALKRRSNVEETKIVLNKVNHR